MSLSQPLLINSQTDNQPAVEYESKPKSKLSRYIHFIYEPLTYPFHCCMTAKCWKTKNLLSYQYELLMLFASVFQILTALTLGSCFRQLFETVKVNSKENSNHLIIFTLIYCVIIYLYATLQIVRIQRDQCLSIKQKGFQAGTFAHITAFGIRELSFLIMDAYFSDTIGLSVLYFFIAFIVSLLSMFILSWLRKSLCFTIKIIKKKIRKRSNSNEIELSLSKTQNVVDQTIETQRNKHEFEEEFNELLHEIDTDIWVIAMGYIFVELVLYIVSNRWIPLEESELHKQTSFYVFIGATSGIIYLFWIVYKTIISHCRVRRDRIVMKSLNNSTINNELSNVNCMNRILIKFSLKFYEESEQIIMFINSFLAWSYGWINVSIAITTKYWDIKLVFALLYTIGGIIYFIIFVKCCTKKIDKWIDNRNDIHNQTINNIGANLSIRETGRNDKKQHRRLYGLLLSTHFFRKSCGLMVAFPWESLFDSLWEIFNENTGDIVSWIINPIMIIFLGIYFIYIGSKYIAIASKIEKENVTSSMIAVLQTYHGNIKNVSGQVN